MDDEAISMMAEAGTYLVADVWEGDWIAEQGRAQGWSTEVLRKNEETTEAQREGFAKCVQAGVRLAYGTDSGVYPHAMVARQFDTMVRLGMTPMEAIQSATVVAAELIGWQDRVGAIEPGLLADLIAVEGGPIERVDALTDVAVVVKGGEVLKGP
jgi:imidazolonepropionase-like amidohydrolase